MEKECCNIKVKELENGFCIEITGEDVKEKCRTIIENCCGNKTPWAEMIKDCMSSCC